MIFLLIIVMLIIIYIVAQNNKIQELFDNLLDIDAELEDKLNAYKKMNGPVDIYTIQEIRTMITKDYIHDHRIDDFRIYKESLYKIKLIIKLGIAVQVLEWQTNEKQIKLREAPLLKSDLELLGQ